MLTPRFTASEEERFVIIKIQIPYADLETTDLTIDGHDFTFYSSPYHLRLRFSGSLVDNEDVSSLYDKDTNNLVVKIPKLIGGEHFENLDMVTALLLPSELSASGDNTESKESELLLNGGYGFNKQHVGVSNKISCVLGDVLHVQSPDEKSNEQIRNERVQAELEAFSEEHYLADFMDDEECVKLAEIEVSALYPDDNFTREQQDILLRLKNVSNIDSIDTEMCLLMLVDFIYCYCYDHRISGGEIGVESGWNISTISATLSWLEYPSDLRSTLIACVRRSLCYPLHRNWNVCMRVVEDVSWLLQRGKKLVVKSLLEIHEAFVVADPRYLYNQLYIDDMLVWVQNMDAAILSCLSERVRCVTIAKCDVDLQLDELESIALLTLNNSPQQPDIAERLCQVRLDSDDDDDGETESSSSSSSDS